MQEPTSPRSAVQNALAHHNKGSSVKARTPYPHERMQQDTSLGILGRIKACFRRIFSTHPAPQITTSKSTTPHAKVVFRSTSSTFITPIGGYAGNSSAPEEQRLMVMEQFKHGHSIPHGTTVN